MSGVAAVNAHSVTQEAGVSSTAAAIFEGAWKSNFTSLTRLIAGSAVENAILFRLLIMTVIMWVPGKLVMSFRVLRYHHTTLDLTRGDNELVQVHHRSDQILLEREARITFDRLSGGLVKSSQAS